MDDLDLLVRFGAAVAAVLLVQHYYQRRDSLKWFPAEPIAPPLDTGAPLTDQSDRGLYPLRHPMWCARQAAKQAVLLEDHLTDIHKQCHDCIRKHFLMMEAFLEEGLVMDKHQRYTEILVPALQQLRPVLRNYCNGAPLGSLAQQIRELRKAMSSASFEYFE